MAGPPLVEDVEAPAEEGAGLLRDALRKSFPVESGATIPGKVVQLMLELSHVETPAETGPQPEDPPCRKRKLRAPLKAAAVGIGVAAAMVRRKRRRRRRA